MSFSLTDKIHHYFGDKIALYFAFLGFYTIALIPPAFIGIIYFVTSWESMYRLVTNSNLYYIVYIYVLRFYHFTSHLI